MNENSKLISFEFEGNEVRVMIIDGEPHWILRDVCANLGIDNPHNVAKQLDEDYRFQITVTDSLGRLRDTTVINESGLYDVLVRSGKPKSKPFRKWIVEEVIPSIRKTGKYSINDGLPKTYLEALKALVANEEERVRLEEEATKLKIENERGKFLLEAQRPAVEFTKSVEDTKDVILVRDLAILMRQNGIDIGET